MNEAHIWKIIILININQEKKLYLCTLRKKANKISNNKNNKFRCKTKDL